MTQFFIDKVRGPLVLVWIVVANAYAGVAFLLTGSWRKLGLTQSGGPEPFWLQTTPLFTEAQAKSAFAHVRAAEAEGLALLNYLLDGVFIILLTCALAALIGYGVRRMGLAAGPARNLVYVALVFGAADMLETGGLAVAMVAGGDGGGLLMRVVSVATAVKFAGMFASLATGLGLTIAGHARGLLGGAKPA